MPGAHGVLFIGRDFAKSYDNLFGELQIYFLKQPVTSPSVQYCDGVSSQYYSVEPSTSFSTTDSPSVLKGKKKLSLEQEAECMEKGRIILPHLEAAAAGSA